MERFSTHFNKALSHLATANQLFNTTTSRLFLTSTMDASPTKNLQFSGNLPPKQFTKPLTSLFEEKLRQITPYFEENLVRAFRNEGLRHQKRAQHRPYVKDLDDILVTEGDTIIELRNLKFPWIPDFRINNFTVNLAMFCLDVDLKLGDLRIEGEYEGNNLALQKLLPVSHNGTIQIHFNEVTAKGRIGLLIEDDSFVIGNYDIDYTAKETLISVKYCTSDGNPIENTITKTNEEVSLADPVWMQVQDLLTRYLHPQVSIIVEFSVSELLDEDEEVLREIAREHFGRANKLLDSLLCVAKDRIVEKNLRLVQTPAFAVTFRGKPTGVQQGKLTTKPGYMQDLSTLTRHKDANLFEDQHHLVVYGVISLGEFKHGYEAFSSQFEGTEVSGSINGKVYSNEIRIKLIVKKVDDQCLAFVDTLRIRTIGDVDADASGLASLSWLVPKLQGWVVGHLRYKGLPSLENHIRQAFEDAINTTDCVSLLSD